MKYKTLEEAVIDVLSKPQKVAPIRKKLSPYLLHKKQFPGCKSRTCTGECQNENI